jgi:hypothetical protein
VQDDAGYEYAHPSLPPCVFCRKIGTVAFLLPGLEFGIHPDCHNLGAALDRALPRSWLLWLAFAPHILLQVGIVFFVRRTVGLLQAARNEWGCHTRAGGAGPQQIRHNEQNLRTVGNKRV